MHAGRWALRCWGLLRINPHKLLLPAGTYLTASMSASSKASAVLLPVGRAPWRAGPNCGWLNPAAQLSARISCRASANRPLAMSCPALLPAATGAEYFTQFGKVTKVRLSRSKKTANSRGYAFLEFQSAEVAKIAAEVCGPGVGGTV